MIGGSNRTALQKGVDYWSLGSFTYQAQVQLDSLFFGYKIPENVGTRTLAAGFANQTGFIPGRSGDGVTFWLIVTLMLRITTGTLDSWSKLALDK